MKKSLIVILILVIAGLSWYLFLKPFDYLVTFRAKTTPGTVSQTIKVWTKKIGAELLEQKNNYSLIQQLRFNDTTVIYDWKIKSLNDSVSNIQVRIKDLDYSLANKIQIPFKNTVLEKRSKKMLLEFNQLLYDHLKSFKVKIIGEEKVEPVFCAYLPVRESQEKKAFGMMANYPYLSGFVDDNNLGIDGIPFIEITNWNRQNDSITYNFCYPVRLSDSLPKHKEIRYKQFNGGKALKAIYNGNYITSDRAWYALLDYAEKNKISVDLKPIEIFFDNPNLGGNELEWKAEIYLPIKSSDQ